MSAQQHEIRGYTAQLAKSADIRKGITWQATVESILGIAGLRRFRESGKRQLAGYELNFAGQPDRNGTYLGERYVYQGDGLLLGVVRLNVHPDMSKAMIEANMMRQVRTHSAMNVNT